MEPQEIFNYYKVPVNILILAPAPVGISPSQRFRFEHYINIPNGLGLVFTVKSFFSAKAWSILHKKKFYFQKGAGVISGLFNRLFLMFTLHKYSYVFIHREAAPIGPPIFEWIIAKLWRKKIIYDFDDAIWVSDASAANPGMEKLKCTWKVERICKMSYIISAGNEYLRQYGLQYCKDARLIPTVVDTEGHHNQLKNQADQPLTIGWTGTFTNFQNLQNITEVINKLAQNHTFEFLIIADKDPQFTNVQYRFIKWNLQTEIADLKRMHIGIMPLAKTMAELGKCGFKAIQYQSIGIPAVVTPIDPNTKIVLNNISGFWADNDSEWYQHLETLIINEPQRTEMGNNARKNIEDNYSVNSSKESFWALFS